MLAAMIKDILIPQKFGNYYFISQRVIGFSINKTSVHATQLLMHGNKITLERFFTEPLTNDVSVPFPERVTQAIKKILAQTDRYDAIRTSIASVNAIFKNLTLPFLERDKIAMVLNYEIEPYLPFPTSDAIIDFIITKSNPEQNNSDVLVSAVQKHHITEHLSYFQAAGVTPTAITIDLFDLYSLYSIMPRYKSDKKTIAIIELGYNFTSIAYLIDGQLSLLRTIPKGITNWAKTIAQSLSSTPQDTLEKIIRFGLEKNSEDAYSKAIHDVVASYLNEIRFTLDSFVAQNPQHKKLETILLLGDGAQLPNIVQFFNEQLTIQTELFDSNNLLTIPGIFLKQGKKISQSTILSLSTALMTPHTQEFNLLKQEFAPSENTLFTKQIITGFVLIGCIFISLLANNFFRLGKLKKEVTASEQEVLSTLKKLGLTNAKSLTTGIREAQEKVSEEEAIWFAFSQQTRVSFLKYLEKLSSAIDRNALGLKITKLIISQQEPSSLTLEGEVKDFDALKILERELKNTNLFLTIPSLQTTKFVLQMPLKKNGVPQ